MAKNKGNIVTCLELIQSRTAPGNTKAMERVGQLTRAGVGKRFGAINAEAKAVQKRIELIHEIATKQHNFEILKVIFEDFDFGSDAVLAVGIPTQA